MGILGKIFGSSSKTETTAKAKATPNANANLKPKSNPNKPYMISQYPALYLYEHSKKAKKDGIAALKELGFSDSQAEKFFDYECGILEKYRKTYLADPDFVSMWAFNLNKPIFSSYPSTKEELKKEHFITVSELSMIIDEAEWHFWNSHEKNLSNEVWGDICRWRMQGAGGNFAVEYYMMIAEELGLPIELMQNISNRDGGLLKEYKWKKEI